MYKTIVQQWIKFTQFLYRGEEAVCNVFTASHDNFKVIIIVICRI